MEDDTDHAGPGSPPESLLPYDRWMEDALRSVVLRALSHVIGEGLPGNHHYYITFRTDYPGVVVPPRLLAKYPQEMTIVLQHQFDKLWVDEATRSFGVSLSFGGVLSPLTVKLDAVSAFADPHVHYALRFSVADPEPANAETPASGKPGAEAQTKTPPRAALPAPDVSETSGATPQVVSLDAFRKRRD